MSMLDESAGERRRSRWAIFWTALGTIATVAGIIIGLVVSNHGDSPTPTPPIIGAGNTAPTTAPTTPTNTRTTPDSTTPTTDIPQLPPPSSQHVALSALCSAPGADTGQGCDQGTHPVGNQLFAFDMEIAIVFADGAQGWHTYFEFPANTCSKLVIHYTPTKGPNGASNTTSARVLQEGPASATVSAVEGQIKTLAADLNGTVFDLQFMSTASSYAWISGYAICTTDTGLAN